MQITYQKNCNQFAEIDIYLPLCHFVAEKEKNVTKLQTAEKLSLTSRETLFNCENLTLTCRKDTFLITEKRKLLKIVKLRAKS